MASFFSGLGGGGAWSVTGSSAGLSLTVSVTIRPIDKAPGALSSIVAAGGNATRINAVNFTIEDDSAGYPEHILNAVAEDKPLSSSGTGLGLRFARMIARAHHNDGRTGSLSLYNRNGAVFEIRLP